MRKQKNCFDALIDSGLLGALLLLVLFTGLVLMMAGCVAIEVEDYGDEVVKDASGNPVCASNGVVQTVHKGQRWHLNKNMVDQAYESVEFERQLQNVIKLRVANYKDAVSPELNKIVDTSFKGAAELAAKVCAAIASSGGSVAGEAAYSALEQKIKSYLAKGGSAEKATVTCNGKDCTISDGTVTETCDDCVLPGWVEPDPVP